MRLHRYPELIERLAAEYALGVMRGGARRRFEQLASREPAIRASIDAWQQRLSALPELAPPVEPPAEVWDALARRLALGRQAPAQAPAADALAARRRAAGARTRWFESLAFWRGWSIAATGAALAAAVALAAILRPFAPGAPEAPVASTTVSPESAPRAGGPLIERVAYVAALADVKTSKTMVFVMWDDKSAMMSVHRMSGGDAPPPGKSEQLWGIPEHGRPVSLGMLPAGKTVAMKVHAMKGFTRLAVSIEPPGGSPDANGPSGPVVCAGKLMATA